MWGIGPAPLAQCDSAGPGKGSSADPSVHRGRRMRALLGVRHQPLLSSYPHFISFRTRWQLALPHAPSNPCVLCTDALACACACNGTSSLRCEGTHAPAHMAQLSLFDPASRGCK
jgi:hypothetical protein